MSPHLTNPLVDQYRRYRSAGKKLNSKILDAVMNETVLDTAARDLNLGKNKRLIFDNESEPDVLMDYALYEIPQGGQTLIERYTIEHGGSNRAERDLLEAMLNAKTGLFRVEEVLASRYLLNLQEIIDGNRQLSMIDINFSQYPAKNCVLFFRPIELSDFTMTSGISFVFPPKMERELLKQWTQWDRSERYTKCFKLFKSTGIEAEYR
jgi:hypothetical protein